MSIKRGDTIIEILFALSVFSLIAILSINLMNNGVVSAQASLETTMVRNEVNAQAEALRFIHGTVTSGSSDNNLTELWNKITELAKKNVSDSMKSENFSYPPDGIDASCADYYDSRKTGTYIGGKNAFILNTRHLTQQKSEIPAIRTLDSDFAREAGNYARVFYNKDTEDLKTDTAALEMKNAEGIWIIGVPSANKISKGTEETKIPQYYDFYIQSCWYNPGKNTPSTIDTVVRLYNPADAGEKT